MGLFVKMPLSLFLLLIIAPGKVFSQTVEEPQTKAVTYNHPEEFLIDFLTKVDELKDTDNSEKFQKFQELVPIYFDVKKINLIVLGKKIRDLSDTEKEAFRPVFTEFLLLTLISNKFTSGGQFQIIRTSTNEKGTLHRTKSLFSHPDLTEKLQMVWVIKQRKGEAFYQILDVKIEGLSYILSWRTQNESIIRSKGFEGLMRQTQEQIEKLKEVLKIDSSGEE